MMKNFLRKYTSLLGLIIFSVVVPSSFGQWVSNPEVNTKIVSDVLNPINLSTVTDGSGGGFVFWQDTKNDGFNRIYYIHFNNDASISFRTDGKRVTIAKGSQVNPVVKYGNDGNAVVLWLGSDEKGKNELCVQKLTSKGNLIWSENGIKITNTIDDVSDYSMVVDRIGNIYVSYLAKEPGFLGDFKVMLKKVNFDGTLDSTDVLVHRSNNSMSTTNIATDKDIGVFVFWMENMKGKSILMCQHLGWKLESPSNQGLLVSITNKSVGNYLVSSFGKNRVYVCWQYESNKKEINQSLISDKLESLWSKNQFLVSNKISEKKDIQLFSDNNNLWACWTADSSGSTAAVIKIKDKDDKVIKFNKNISNSYQLGNAFNPIMVSDENNGALLSWFSYKTDMNSPVILAQRISSTGELLWEKNGIVASSSSKSVKSNLSIIPDLNGGAFIVFKDFRNRKPGIFAQRIFSNGTYVSQIVSFTASLQSDSVHISCYAANESDSSFYVLEKMNSADTASTNWWVIDTIYAAGEDHLASYDYFDEPGNAGTIYYRLSHNDAKGNSQYSEVARVNYISKSSDIIVAQNDPNPFSDSTRISFYLPKTTYVSVEFFNSKIQKIDEIKRMKYSAGRHDILFRRYELEPGIYFYRIRVGKFVEVKKMVITKN
jgi:hypothetical protein